MIDLIRRLEAATGPDREIDADIGRVFGRLKPPYPHDAGFEYLRYTESLDAALTLVPEDCRWELGVYPMLGFCGAVWTDVLHRGFGRTPAIALLIAALRARESGE